VVDDQDLSGDDSCMKSTSLNKDVVRIEEVVLTKDEDVIAILIGVTKNAEKM